MAVRDDKLGWLIRDPNNTIRGPFTHTEVSQFLKKKALRPKTELSQANSYWFALEEKTELDKFFSDAPVPEVESQDFTSTLTESFIEKSNPKIEFTQFIATPAPAEEQAPKVAGQAAGGDEGVQWLSNEYAEEFGIPVEESASNGDILTRATVKADTLVSELQTVKTEIPQSVGSVIRKESRAAGPSIVTMSTAPVLSPANIVGDLDQETEEKSRRLAVKWLVLGGVLFTVLVGFFFSIKSKPSHLAASSGHLKPVGAKNVESTLRRAFLFSDLELAKSVTAELSSSGNSEYLSNLSNAMIKKNFLVDLDGAILNLNAARTSTDNPKMRAEVDNLISIYNADKDILAASSHAKLALDVSPGEGVYRYNLALAEFIAGDTDGAAKDLSAANLENTDKSLFSDILTLKGWIAGSSKQSAAEELLQKALELDPNNANAQLLLAIHNLQEKRNKDAESEFRKFVDSMPDLEIFHLENFRKMSSVQLVDRVRIELRALNSGGTVTRVSPATMAADALLSANQNKLTEADKILDAALMISPGNIDLLKARAYLRWKEAKYDEIIELLKDLPRDQRGSFGYNLLLGMAYEKMGKYSVAIHFFQQLTDIDPERSEAWSLYGEAQMHLKQNIEAKQNFQQALIKNPTDIRALQGLFSLGDEKVLDNPAFNKLLPF